MKKRSHRSLLEIQRIAQELANKAPFYDASKFIEHLQPWKGGPRGVTLYVRMSTCWQTRRGKLKQAVKRAIRELKGLGYVVVTLVRGHENWSIFEERRLLNEAIHAARANGTILVAQSRDRFIRHIDFNRTNDSEIPSETEYQELIRLADGVRLVTIVHPNKGDRAGQTRRGQQASTEKIGRPKGTRKKGWSAERFRKYSPWAVAWKEEGKNGRWIKRWFHARTVARFPRPCEKTIYTWIKKAKVPKKIVVLAKKRVPSRRLSARKRLFPGSKSKRESVKVDTSRSTYSSLGICCACRVARHAMPHAISCKNGEAVEARRSRPQRWLKTAPPPESSRCCYA